MRRTQALAIVLAVALFTISFAKPESRSEEKVNKLDNDNLLLGNPSSANSSSIYNYFLDRKYYVMSYNAPKNIPNWVSWHLDAQDIGTADRQNDFRSDSSLPSYWYKVSNASYSGTGFDRGHNCPSADRTNSIEANSSTFLMTNMIPQAPNLNRRTWANLEDYTRDLIRIGYEAYIVMGSYGNGGIGTNGYKTQIDHGRIRVPSNLWKVIVIIPHGNNDLKRINASTRVIAINTPNSNGASSNWRLYCTTVDAIEKATGYDLLSNLPYDIQRVLESRRDAN